jgi:predicted Rossmann fold flavoprotein
LQQLTVIIIGGGAAGFFAAIHCAEANPAAKVIILERGKEVLGKVKISGGGRCNLSHACWEPKELIKHYPRGARALLGPFHRFCTGDTVDWFEKRGVATKIEEDNRIFPVSDKSQSVMTCLTEAARKAGVEVRLGKRVEKLLPPSAHQKHWRVQLKGEELLEADKVMVATGSNPAMWKDLARLGHTIVKPVPSLFTFNIKDARIEGLAGLSVPNARVKVIEAKLTASGPLLITHWGMSGPGILKLSAWGARELHQRQYDFTLEVNWVADRNYESVVADLKKIQQEEGRRQPAKRPLFGLPARLWQRLCQAAGLRPVQNWAETGKKTIQALAKEITAGEYAVKGKSTFKEEFVTAGGVDLDEVDFRTFASKKLPGLYFAGEVLNIDAITGGFNFQAAWTGGWIAGQTMATR